MQQRYNKKLYRFKFSTYLSTNDASETYFLRLFSRLDRIALNYRQGVKNRQFSFSMCTANIHDIHDKWCSNNNFHYHKSVTAVSQPLTD